MAYRFGTVDIAVVTIDNYQEHLPPSLIAQVAMFIPPSGSFTSPCLRRYLESVKAYEEEDAHSGLTLANRIRLAFSDMVEGTICERFPTADLPMKRRLRCVGEYCVRAGELIKQRDENGKLIKRRGALGKQVVLYQGTPKLLESLARQGIEVPQHES